MRELLQSRGNKIAAGVLALVAIALAFANPLWIPIILILGGLGIVTVAWVKAVRRSRESFFSAYANQRGLSMKLDDTPDRRLNGTPLLRMGEDSWVEHLMTGALDDQTQGLLGHWTYTTSYRDADGNEQTSYHSFTVAMTEVPEARERLPFFLAHRREGIRMFDKAEDAVLGRDVKRIEFESDALDRRYEIFAPPEQDQSFVRQLFSPKFIVWMSEEAPKKFAFEYEDGVLCCSVDRELDSAEELDALRAATAGVARRLREEALEG